MGYFIYICNIHVDVDECINSDCEHICTNIDGSYICSCIDGYSLDENGRNCSGMIQNVLNSNLMIDITGRY